MKSQSLKLFAIAFVVGLAAIFASAGRTSAQTPLTFDVPFDFQVGRDKLAKGRYRIQKIGDSNYLLRNLATNNSRMLFFKISTSQKGSAERESLVFNRYGETYFLNSLYENRGNLGKALAETGFEKQFREEKGGRNQLAGQKIKPERVSVKQTN